MMNGRYKDGNYIDIPVPVGTLSGAPLIFGAAQIPVVAQIDRQSDGTASVARTGSFLFTVKAINAGGNSAVAVGDTIYFDDAATPKLNKVATGAPFGVALTTLASGATGEVEVLLLKK
jgi:hypothetical protein